MKPNEIASLLSEYLEEGTTPKGMKIQSLFGHLTTSQKRTVANNIAKAYALHLEEEMAKEEIKKEKKKEISELKKKAKELGFIISEA